MRDMVHGNESSRILRDPTTNAAFLIAELFFTSLAAEALAPQINAFGLLENLFKTASVAFDRPLVLVRLFPGRIDGVLLFGRVGTPCEELRN